LIRYGPAGVGVGRLPAAVRALAIVGGHEEFDPDICATVGCGAAAAMTYLGRPRCQACFEDDVQENDETTDSESQTPNDEENDMATKKTTKKSAKKVTKRSPRAAKAAKPAKATSPKAARKPLTQRVKGKAAGDQPKRTSALDAAATVLKKAGEPMNAKAMITAMAEQGLWTSPNGKTPHATLYAAILREIGTKGGEARFRKSDRGLFEYAGI
jgi:flagellar biosynthesis GTPase FlhF